MVEDLCHIQVGYTTIKRDKQLGETMGSKLELPLHTSREHVNDSYADDFDLNGG